MLLLRVQLLHGLLLGLESMIVPRAHKLLGVLVDLVAHLVDLPGEVWVEELLAHSLA